MKIAPAAALVALVLVCGIRVSFAATPPARGEFHRSYPLSATGTFSITDGEGSIRIVGWDQNTVQIDALECAPTAGELKNLTITVDTSPRAVAVHTLYPPNTDGWFWRIGMPGASTSCNERPRVDYTVHVPDRARVSLTTTSADMDVAGPIGGLTADTTSGDLTATDIGDATLRSISGSMTLTQAKGSVAASSTSGDIQFSDTQGDLNLSSTSGEVRLYRIAGKAVVTTTSGDITARAFSGIAHVSSTSGDISMTLVHAKGVALSASTVSGAIRSDVPMIKDAPLDLRTVSGDISVRTP